MKNILWFLMVSTTSVSSVSLFLCLSACAPGYLFVEECLWQTRGFQNTRSTKEQNKNKKHKLFTLVTYDLKYLTLNCISTWYLNIWYLNTWYLNTWHLRRLTTSVNRSTNTKYLLSPLLEYTKDMFSSLQDHKQISRGIGRFFCLHDKGRKRKENF